MQNENVERSRIIIYINASGARERKEISLGSKLTQAEFVEIKEYVSVIRDAVNANRRISDPIVNRWIHALFLNPQKYGVKDLYSKLANVGLIEPRPENQKKELGKSLDSFISFAAGEAYSQQTLDHYRHIANELKGYFGPDTPLDFINRQKANEWRKSKVDQGYADSTVSGYLKNAKRIFRYFVEEQHVNRNPFEFVKQSSKPIQSRKIYISCDLISQLIDLCIDPTLKVVLALARYGGLRIPSDIVLLTKDHFDFERDIFRIDALKGERAILGVNRIRSRVMPIFPILKRYIKPYVSNLKKGEMLFPYYQEQMNDIFAGERIKCKEALKFSRFLRKLNLSPWEKLFVNLRASCATDLFQIYDFFKVCSWLGHSLQVSIRHYKMITMENNHLVESLMIDHTGLPVRSSDFGISEIIGTEFLKESFKMLDLKTNKDN